MGSNVADIEEFVSVEPSLQLQCDTPVSHTAWSLVLVMFLILIDVAHTV